MSIDVGSTAPAFTLKDQTGSEVSLSDYAGKQAVALVFYPFTFTGVCEGELCALRDDIADFEAKGVQVIAVSCDTAPSQKVWAEQKGWTFPVLSDFWPHGEVAKAYGVFNDAVGCANRATFLIDQQGVGYGKRGEQQRGFDMLALARPVAVDDRRHGRDGEVLGRGIVDVGDHEAVGLFLRPGAIDRARHDLPDAVETDAVGIGTATPVGRGTGKDDVWLDALERLVVEPVRFHHPVGHVDDDDIGGFHQLVRDLAPFLGAGVERDAALAAVIGQVACAAAIG